jgi:hypothetical protein
MYLFTRRTRLAPGHGTAGIDWACSVAVKARELTGRRLEVWGNLCSPAAGTVSWNGWFRDFESLEHFGAALGADPAMEKVTNAGARYTDGGFDDDLLEPISLEPISGSSAGPGAGSPVRFASVIGARATGEGYTQAIAAGLELARTREAVTGRPTIFGQAVTGNCGALRWLTGYESAAEMEQDHRTLAADPGWLALLDSTRSCFESASTVRLLARRFC